MYEGGSCAEIVGETRSDVKRPVVVSPFRVTVGVGLVILAEGRWSPREEVGPWQRVY